MEIKNYERELKYLTLEGQEFSFKEVIDIFLGDGYSMVENRRKKKHEIYFDDADLSVIKNGDVIRGSTHFNKDGTYFHFMFKKNVSRPDKPYVSKYEYGSGQFETVQDFVVELGMQDIAAWLNPVLHAEMTRKTAVFEKEERRLLVSYDDVEYYKDTKDVNVYEKMLEVEDWTTPYTTIAENDVFDEHLLSINKRLLSKLPIQLTKNSKPYRGFLLLGGNL